MLIQFSEAAKFQRIRENKEFENDWYFVSQLFETNWQPQFTV